MTKEGNQEIDPDKEYLLKAKKSIEEKGFFLDLPFEIFANFMAAIYNKNKFDRKTKKKSKDNIENLLKLKEVVSGKQKEYLEKIGDVLDFSRTKDFIIKCEKFLQLYIEEMIEYMGFTEFFSIYLENLENIFKPGSEKDACKLLILMIFFRDFSQKRPSWSSEKEKEMFEKITKCSAEIKLQLDSITSKPNGEEDTLDIIEGETVKIRTIFEDYIREQNLTTRELVSKVGSKTLGSDLTSNQAGEQTSLESSNPKLNLPQTTENTILKEVPTPVLKAESKSLGSDLISSQASEQTSLESSNPKLNLPQITENTSLKQVPTPVLVKEKFEKKPILRRFVDWIRQYLPSFAKVLDKFLNKFSSNKSQGSLNAKEITEEKPLSAKKIVREADNVESPQESARDENSRNSEVRQNK